MTTEPMFTARGFRIYKNFKDRYGTPISVTESSLATEACVWIQTGDNPQIPEPNAHLTVAMAKQVIEGLQEFVDQYDTSETDEEPGEDNQP